MKQNLKHIPLNSVIKKKNEFTANLTRKKFDNFFIFFFDFDIFLT